MVILQGFFLIHERSEDKLAITLRATVNYATNGTQTVFEFNFDYLRASFVKVKLNGVSAYVYGTDYLVSNRSIEFLTAPPADGMLTIYRQTPTDRLVAFAEGSVLKATDLSINQVQTIHILEETLDTIYQTSMTQNGDGNWDAQNRRIVNVRDPIDEQDAVTYQFLKTYSSLGDTGLDPEDIKKLLTGINELSDEVQLLEQALAKVRDSIPTKISQLENDDHTVKDEAYVHTDHNLTDDYKGLLDRITEITCIDFSSTSPYWNGNTLTLEMPSSDFKFIALYRTSSTGAVLDISTPCRQLGSQIIVEASSPFAGYVMLTGVVAYGDLNELLAVILNEEAEHTYTLEEIIGEPYKEPVYPDAAQCQAYIDALNNCANVVYTKCADKVVEAEAILAQVRSIYDSIVAKESTT